MSTILIVDDYRVHLRMYRHILRKHGHRVLLAEHAHTALEHLKAESVDLVVSDVAMPDMNGVALVKQLRSDERYHMLPVVLVTSSKQEQEELIARNIRANAYLTKPTSSRELIDTVLSLLGGRIIGNRF